LIELSIQPRPGGETHPAFAIPVGLHEWPMPSLIRLLVVLGILSGIGYGAVFALATLVEPKPREITVTVPQDKLAKPR
jgi:hypothetical protein